MKFVYEVLGLSRDVGLEARSGLQLPVAFKLGDRGVYSASIVHMMLLGLYLFDWPELRGPINDSKLILDLHFQPSFLKFILNQF